MLELVGRPFGQTFIVQAKGARFWLNMLWAVNAQGMFRFIAVQSGVHATVFREFLKQLITGMTRKVFLMVDGQPMHKAQVGAKIRARKR